MNRRILRKPAAKAIAAIGSDVSSTSRFARCTRRVVVDRLNRRVVSSVTLAIQITGVVLLASRPEPASVNAGCVLFGLGIGNLTTLPGLILAVEWPRERFSTLVGLVVGINQLTFAFGPSLVGMVRDWSGGYGAALGACAVLQAVAAALVVLGPGRPLAPQTLHRRPA